MATITAFEGYQYSLANLNANELLYGSYYAGYHNYYLVAYYDNTVDYFEGFGFTYDVNGTPWTGTVTSYTFAWIDSSLDFYQLLEISDIAVPASSIANTALTASTADDQALTQARGRRRVPRRLVRPPPARRAARRRISQRGPMNNFLEQLAAEWFEFQGYYVRRNVRVAPRANGGHEGELDIVAFNPSTRRLVHVESSMDADSWKQRELRFARKFELGRKYIPSLFQNLNIPSEPEQIALLVFASDKNRQTLGGGRIVLIQDFMDPDKEAPRREEDRQRSGLRAVHHPAGPPVRTPLLALGETPSGRFG
jgi:hypothetical protein